MDPVLVYNHATQTIRQMPQNYLIAQYNGFSWHSEPDLAADKELALRVYLALFDHETKYNKDGLFLLSKVTPNTTGYIKELVALIDPTINGVKEDIIAVMDSCVEGYTKEWDPTDMGADGFGDMYQLLQRVAEHFGIDTSTAKQFPEE
jgi:hypothetical protein